MKTLAALGIALCVAGAQCYAATTVGGKLMDAQCYNEKKVASEQAGHKTYQSPITKTCVATPASTAFAIRVTSGPYHQWEGDTVKLDDQGNSMMSKAMQAGTLQPDKDGEVHVVASGQMLASETLLTKSVESGRRRIANRNAASIK